MKLSLLILMAGLAWGSDFYKLENIKRIEKDLYRSGDVLIETRYCYEYASSDTVILKYEGGGEYSGSSIIWENNSACEVRRVVGLNQRNLGDVPGLIPWDEMVNGGVKPAPPRAAPKPPRKRWAAIIGGVLGGAQ
jgi:hypothetical protein